MSLDELSRGLASGSISRRRALTVLGASAAAALFPFAGRAGATLMEPDKCKTDTDCPEGKECRYGKCFPKKHEKPTPDKCKTDTDCPEGKECRYGKCLPKKPEKPKKCLPANCEKKVYGKTVADHSKCPQGCQCKKRWVGKHYRFRCG